MDTPLQIPLDVPDYPTEHLLYGDDPLQGVVAVERVGLNGMRIYRREDGGLVREEALFNPWLLAERREYWGPLRGVRSV